MAPSTEAERNASLIREALRKISSGKQVRPRGLIDRLKKASGLNYGQIGDAFAFLRATGEVTCRAWTPPSHGPLAPLGMLQLELAAKPVAPAEAAWLEAVQGSDFEEAGKEVLRKLAGKVSDMPQEDMQRLLAGLAALRDSKEALDMPIYEASARWLLGSSKILSALGAVAMRNLGIALEEFAPPPRYLALAGPSCPKAFTLVENPHAFEAAVRADSDREYAWACSYGFGFSMDQRYGELLETNLTCYAESLTLLVRDGNPPPLSALLGCENLFFWGDLDPSGLRIFESLKKRYPRLRLSPLYSPLIWILLRGGGHPYVKATGKDGQKEQEEKCGPFDTKEAQDLAVLCSGRGVDQEALGWAGIREWMGLSDIIYSDLERRKRMTDEDIELAALSDPDALPLPEEQWAGAKVIRGMEFLREQLARQKE